MSRPLKLLAGTATAILALLLALALYLTLSFDPNSYRDEISHRVQAETGRSLTFDGDIELHLFPWIGLKLGATKLSGPETFSNQDFITIGSASVKVRLMPLLQQRLEVDTIVLHGLTASLVTDINGNNNWDFATRSPDSQPPSGIKSEPDTAARPAAAALSRLHINGLDLRDAKLSWVDARQQSRLTLDQLSLTTGPVGPDAPIDIDLSFKLSGEPLPEQALAIHLTTRTLLNPGEQTLQLSNLQLQTGELQLSGDILATQLSTSPAFSGQIKIPGFKPRLLLQQLGITPPLTQDTAALNSLSADLSFSGDTSRVDITQLSIHLDDTRVQGQIQLLLQTEPATSFTLSLDSIDIDRYLPPPAVATAASDPTAANHPATNIPQAPMTLDLPLDMLRTLDLKGQVSIGDLRVAGLHASNITASLSAEKGLIRLQPLQADLYQGHTRMDLQLDARPVQSHFSLQGSLDDVQAEPILHDLLDNDLVSGQAALKLDISNHGNSLDDLTRSLNGTASLRFTNGAIKGLNIADMIRRAQAKIEKRPVPEPALKQTDFTDLSASLKIKNGIVTNQDLNAQAPFLRITGNGEANLVKTSIDYHLFAMIVADAQGQGGADLASLRGTSIPIRIRGPLTTPVISLDNDLLKARLKEKVTEQVKEKVEEKIQQKQDDVKARLQEQKDQARDKLKQKLKQLF